MTILISEKRAEQTQTAESLLLPQCRILQRSEQDTR